MAHIEALIRQATGAEAAARRAAEVSAVVACAAQTVLVVSHEMLAYM